MTRTCTLLSLLALLACDSDPVAVQQHSNPPPPLPPQADLDALLAVTPLECPKETEVEWTSGRSLAAACTRNDGTPHGPFLSWWNLDGAPRATRGSHFDGVLHGKMKRWNADGSTYEDAYYFHGLRTAPLEDVLGVCAPGSELLQEGEWSYHNYGPPWPGCYALHPEKGVVRHGPKINFCGENDDGLPRVESVMFYRWGLRHGPWYSWWSEDQLSSEFHYVEGEEHGTRRSWYRDGTLSSESHYIRGKRIGISRDYRPDGSLRWEAEFRNGTWISTHGDTSILDRECPEGSAPIGDAPPHGLQIQCVDFSGEHDQASLPAVTWVDGEPVLDAPPVFGPFSKEEERCGPSRLTP